MAEIDQVATELRDAWDVAAKRFDTLSERVDDIEVRWQKTSLDTTHAPAPTGDLLTKSDSVAAWVEQKHGRRDDGDEVRFGALIAAMARPEAKGILNPSEVKVLGEGIGSEGGFVVPEAVAARVVDRVRNQTRVIEAGAQTMPMEAPTVYIPRLATGVDGSQGWRTENSTVSEQTPAFDRLSLIARSCAVMTRMSYELMEDATDAGIRAIENELTAALAVALDYAVLRGAGTDSQPLGIVNASGVLTTELGAGNGSTPTDYDFLVDAVAAVKAQNHAAPTVAMLNSTTEAVLGKLKTGITNDKTPLQRPAYLDGVRFIATNQLPNNLTVGGSSDCSEVIVGGFDQVVIGVRPSLGVRLARFDSPYATSMQYLLIAHLRADVAILHPEALHVTTGVRD
jgi:HK97 family phage major capsid protein